LITENHWFKAAVTGGSGAPYASIYVPDPDTLYVANYKGDMYKSVNAGTSFSLLKHFTANGFMDIHFIDPQKGYICFDRFIFKTINGGTTWTKVVTIGEGIIHELHFTDANHGWACADNGTVLIFTQ
jgi:hypothetical protein